MQTLGMGDVILIEKFDKDGKLILQKEIRRGKETILFKEEE